MLIYGDHAPFRHATRNPIIQLIKAFKSNSDLEEDFYVT